MSRGEVLSWLRRHSGEMTALVEQLVALESPSGDPERQRAIADVVAGELAGCGMAVRRVRGEVTGDHLLARPRDRTRGRPCQLLLGHMDTVWPAGTTTVRPTRRERDHLVGPGSFDMKGGLVQMIWALRAARALDLAPPADPVVLVSSDEEIGSPDSRRWIGVLARLAQRVLVLEGAAGPGGALKIGRKGVGRYVVRARGRSAHAGLEPETGVSAVLEIAHQIQALFALNDPERGITVNVGTVDGGMRPNVVAPEATAHVDVRVATAEDARAVDRAIRSLQPNRDGIRLEIEGGIGRPPMEPTAANLALWRRAEEIGRELGLSLRAEQVGGASDANLTSPHAPTLDGLGAVGGGAHAPDEHLMVATLPERAALVALLLVEPLNDQPGRGRARSEVTRGGPHG